MADYDHYAPDYDVWAAGMTADVPWYVSLAREAAEPIVELGVGTGRIAIPIARETGKRVLGIDLSPALLAVGRERAGGLPVEFREGDMRELSLDEPVELILCPARALMHLAAWADKRRVFERVAASLRPGGRFAFNLFALDGAFAAQLEGKRVEHGDSWEVPHYVWADGRIDLVRGRGDEQVGVLRLWWMTRAEIEGLLDVSGLEPEALHGGFAGEPYDEASRELVWVARKPA
ncbi:MAG TPA: class I SAM-dependent methyltransferase [Gaiellaceae bacterium]|nr:class I SAM-dependent methyltransferase [Gaiellaceae bacterium]